MMKPKAEHTNTTQCEGIYENKAVKSIKTYNYFQMKITSIQLELTEFYLAEISPEIYGSITLKSFQTNYNLESNIFFRFPIIIMELTSLLAPTDVKILLSLEWDF